MEGLFSGRNLIGYKFDYNPVVVNMVKDGSRNRKNYALL